MGFFLQEPVALKRLQMWPIQSGFKARTMRLMLFYFIIDMVFPLFIGHKKMKEKRMVLKFRCCSSGRVL